MDDPLIGDYDASELEIAAEFLTIWLPFLTRGICDGCSATLRDRIRCLHPGATLPPGEADLSDAPGSSDPNDSGPRDFKHIEPSGWDTDPEPAPEPNWRDKEPEPAPQPSGLDTDPSDPLPEASGWDTDPPAPATPKVRMSWADMAQEEELEEEEEEARRRNSRQEMSGEGKKKPELSREQREQIRFRNIGRKKDFICLERVNGKIVNILDGLELHTGVFSTAEQKRIVDFVYELQQKGRNNELGEHTYSEPQKWMRGKGRVTIQFGCCYNYATKNGVPPGIIQSVLADPMPPLFKVIIKRLVQWHVLSTTCVPDSCIVNIYEPGDCIPPHIDSHDFVRPFTTVSFLSECDILFGSNLKIAGAGEFTGSTAISLPVGSVLVLNGNGADVAKHCVPAVPTKRISITFRKMDENKQPIGFTPEPDLQNICPLQYDSRGSQNGKGATGAPSEQSDGEHKSWKNGKNSRGRRPSRANPGADFHHRQKLPYDPDTHMMRSAHRDLDARPTMSGDIMDRGREPVRRSFESKPLKPNSPDTTSRQDNADGFTKRSPRPSWLDEESGILESSGEYSGRRVHLQQKRIVVSRNMEGEEEPMRRGPFDESESGSREYSGRSFLSDQKRTVMSRRNRGEEESIGMGGRSSEPGIFSRVLVQSLNNGRRRVRVSLSDD